MGDRYVKSDETKMILFVDAIGLYGHSMSRPSPYDETNFDRNVKLDIVINYPDDNVI